MLRRAAAAAVPSWGTLRGRRGLCHAWASAVMPAASSPAPAPKQSKALRPAQHIYLVAAAAIHPMLLRRGPLQNAAGDCKIEIHTDNGAGLA